MKIEDLQTLDPQFDFKNTYRENAFTLINLFIVKVDISRIFIIDGKPSEIKYSKPVYQIRYREFQNENSFELLPNSFFSSEKKLSTWMKDNLKKYFDKVSESKAYQLAIESIEWHKKLQKQLGN